MILKMIWRNIKKHLLANMICMLQMIVIFITVIIIVSTIVSRFSFYLPLKEILQSNSDYYTISFGHNPYTGTSDLRKSTLHSFLQGSPAIIGNYEAVLANTDENGLLDYNAFEIRAYDDVWIKSYTPEIEIGEWLGGCSLEDDCIPAVLSSNTQYHVGDEFTMKNEGVNDTFHIKVIGILKNGANILEPNPDGSNLDYRYFYYPYFSEIERGIRMIVPLSFFEESFVLFTEGHFLLTYDKGTPDSVRLYNKMILQECGYSISISTEDLQKNSMKYIYSQCNNLIPMLIAIILFVIISIMSSTAISVKREIKNYAVYYICGKNWNYCVLIHFMSYTLISIFSMCISIIGVGLLRHLSIFAKFDIFIGLWQIICCIAFALLFSFISVIIPYHMIKKQFPVEVFHSN